MPLVHGYSKNAVSENVRTERAAGRPEDQALAIALSEARRARKRRAMFRGGEAAPDRQDGDLEAEAPPPEPKTDDMQGYADGGETQGPTDYRRFKGELEARPSTTDNVRPPIEAEIESYNDEEPPYEGDDMTELARRLKSRKRRMY